MLLLLFSLLASALDVKDFTYRHFSMQDGMSNQRVFSMRQTQDGVVWWTTKCGVDRTNGAFIHNYTLQENAGAKDLSSYGGRVIKLAHRHGSMLSDDQIYAFDNVGRLFKYEKNQNAFLQVCNMSAFFDGEIIVNDVYITEDGFLAGMADGVYRLMATDENDTQGSENGYRLMPVSDSLFVNAIETYREGELLVCAKSGVFAMPEKAAVRTKMKQVAKLNAETAYYDPSTSRLWVGTYDASVKVLDTKNEYQVVTDMAGSIPSNPIRRIVPYDDKTMLMGVDGFGVYVADRQDGQSPRLLFDAGVGRHGVLHANGVYDILIDNEQDIFVGTYSGGVDIARPVGCTVAHFKHLPGNIQSLMNDHVNTVMQLDSDHLLMGTDDGVSILDQRTMNWQHAAIGHVVLDVCRSPVTGRLLIATYGSGVCEVGTDGVAHPLLTEDNGLLQDNHVYSIIIDRQQNLWVGSLLGQIAVIGPHGIRYYDETGVNALTELRNGLVAVGTNHGLSLVDHQNDTIYHVDYRERKDEAPNRYILDVHETADGRLWIATDGGGVYVCEMDGNRRKSVCQITTDDGLPCNTVCNIAEDATGRIWFGTERGMAFTRQDDPKDVVDVNHRYGLMTEYVRGGVTTLSDGCFLYGTGYGALIVNPQNVQNFNYSAALYLRGVRISGNGQNSQPELISLSDADAETLALDYDQRTFELFFEAVSQRHYYDIAYQYKVGETSEWSEPNETASIRFENLEPGKHHLYIRCVSKSCANVLDEREILICVAQPWWNTWWMWCIYVTLLILAFYGAWRVYDLHSRYMALIKELAEDKPLVPLREENDLKEEKKEEVEEQEEAEVEEDEAEATPFVAKATNIVLENITDVDFNIDALCRDMAMSRTLFYVKLKTYTGKSPQDFVRVIRMEKAATLLRHGHSVADVSVMVGFANPKYFSTVFKGYFGVSPSKFQ